MLKEITKYKFVKLHKINKIQQKLKWYWVNGECLGKKGIY